MKTVIWLIIFIISVSLTPLYAKTPPRAQLANEVMDYILMTHKFASDAKVVGKTLKIKIVFNHDKASKVIHDKTIITMAKPYGIKRIEFHDWNNFAKGYLTTNIK